MQRSQGRLPGRSHRRQRRVVLSIFIEPAGETLAGFFVGARAVPRPQRARQQASVRIFPAVLCFPPAATGDRSRSVGGGVRMRPRLTSPRRPQFRQSFHLKSDAGARSKFAPRIFLGAVRNVPVANGLIRGSRLGAILPRASVGPRRHDLGRANAIEKTDQNSGRDSFLRTDPQPCRRPGPVGADKYL